MFEQEFYTRGNEKPFPNHRTFCIQTLMETAFPKGTSSSCLIRFCEPANNSAHKTCNFSMNFDPSNYIYFVNYGDLLNRFASFSKLTVYRNCHVKKGVFRYVSVHGLVASCLESLSCASSSCVTQKICHILQSSGLVFPHSVLFLFN